MLHLLFPQIEKFFSFQYFVHQRIAAWWAEVDVGGDAFLGNIHVVDDVDDVVVVGGGGGPMLVE